MPRAMMVWCSSSFSSLAQAAVQASRPMTAVLWKPLSHLFVFGLVCQGQADLAAHYVGFQQVAAGGAGVFAYGQQRRKYGYCGVAEATEVIKVQRVAHGAVGQGGISLGALEPGGQDCGLWGSPLAAGVFLNDLTDRLLRAR